MQHANSGANSNPATQPAKQPVMTQAVPPPSPTIGLSDSAPPVSFQKKTLSPFLIDFPETSYVL